MSYFHGLLQQPHDTSKKWGNETQVIQVVGQLGIKKELVLVPLNYVISHDRVFV